MEQLITNLGFPIASVVACGNFIFKMQQQQREDTNKREERMFEQMNNITLTLSNINTSLELINERIERLEEQNE